MSSNPKEIKRRIISIESVMKTTEAMKMISTVKLKKYKNILKHIKYYLNHLELVFLELIMLTGKKIENNKYFYSSNENGKKLFIVFTSNRGLCGSFNSLIFEKINFILKKNFFLHKDCIFFSTGKKGFDFLSKRYHMYGDFVENLNDIQIQYFTTNLISDFFNKIFSSVYLIYNKLKNSLLQEVTVEKFLPFQINNIIQKKKDLPFILEPSKKEIINYIIPKILHFRLRKVFSESLTAEHTARMISMHQATENASHIKNNLILNYNKERQTTITKEILEIIGGLDSLQ
ncbi:ATP synthase F1 subunit gamma [Blattabacterium cuenoti]|uniref:ATP synthase F1 subunit gamma n=1 Tax=Blattabacterium cuenoti TaxID=1653831 RepID=UPI00163C9C3D|nr:ATP synthase F1 subunit gamma [Blattabacterium cuenoti]